ncbi:TonB-dependent receptor plug domain-containing protein [Sphingomonas flavalba]|uniref:TonB-dependent receptor plug domain-containing protein n=1 Tax=Sphingomonas flavalba TaxID=2559804 RepID=UPI001EF056E9|nr:TonB-dependent receptor [Sphingomonas flavalba]
MFLSQMLAKDGKAQLLGSSLLYPLAARHVCGGAALALAVTLSPAAFAQSSDPEGGAEPQGAVATLDSPEIVVTGSRIMREGYDSPVPVSVIGAEDIEARKPANIADIVFVLPSVSAAGSHSSADSSRQISTGNAGINAVNLRGLGTSRTLILLNGQRVAPSSFSGLVDVNTFPQGLVERVEVVTGGASAQYGSDAVGGVINFILNENFEGVKLGVDSGISTYGDGHNYRLSGTAGFSLLEDRVKILLNAEYAHQDGIHSIDRDWQRHGYNIMNNPAYVAGNGLPQYYVGPGIGLSNRIWGGLITSGPLRGTYFTDDGVTKQLNYGVLSATSSPFMIGGDWRLTDQIGVGSSSLYPGQERSSVFGRVSYALSPSAKVYGQFSWSGYNNLGYNSSDLLNITVGANNGFLTTQYPDVAAAMNANGLETINVGLWTEYKNGSRNSRDAFRYVLGTTGDFSLFGRDWSWDAYYQHGVTKTHERAVNSLNNARFNLALDSVEVGGEVVCRSSIADPANGCVPIDLLGRNQPSQASLDYVFGPEQPWRKQRFTQDVAAVALSGEIFELPGGAASVALGAEWREEKARGTVGETSSSGWRFGNYRVNRGERNVKEAFVETSLPFFKGFDLNLAGRFTDYSTSGSVQTWKVGATYSPIPDIEFRGSYSRDIRAPNLEELFANPSGVLQGVTLPGNAPVPGYILARIATLGNVDLQPEKAKTWTAGTVLRPSFMSGFTASLDYWNIDINDVIGSVGYQSIIDRCYSGITQFCDRLVFDGNQLDTVLVTPVNFGSRRASGLDIQASYALRLSDIAENVPGTFRVHASFVRNMKNIVDDLVLTPYNRVGELETPKWTYRVTAYYNADPVSLSLSARGVSDLVYSKSYVECESACPASTLENRTINNNNINGAIYFDGTVAFGIQAGNVKSKLSFIVNNILNRDPTLLGTSISGGAIQNLQTRHGLFDTMGRVFRVSLTAEF